MLDLYDELKAILGSLYEHRIPYALCGGLAVSILAEPRATVDVDFLLLPEMSDKAASVLRELGYDVEASPMEFAQGKVRIRRLTKLAHEGDSLSVDMLIVTDSLKRVWESRQHLQWEGRPLTIVSKQGLIEMKRLRGSKQDEADIEKLSS